MALTMHNMLITFSLKNNRKTQIQAQPRQLNQITHQLREKKSHFPKHQNRQENTANLLNEI